jgi:hypothetical protein
MNIYIGKYVARCMHCESSDWLLDEPAARFSILSELVCAECASKQTYADLVLQLPFLPSVAVRGGL